jgi:glucose-1-phosphate cytidylyltransferase
MKTVILAGGLGTRITEESHLKPKPMIEIGGKPILWHIMKIYSAYGFNEFVICLGYKGYVIKEFFNNYYLHSSDVTFDMRYNNMTVHKNIAEPWKVTLVDTGLNTMTGGRLKRVREYLGNEPFMLTYGDGVSDIDINKLVAFHKNHGKDATISIVNAPQRFGIIDIDDSESITSFREKADNDKNIINGGFMVLNPSVIDRIDDDSNMLEKEPFARLVTDEQMKAYRHDGFWYCMDTLRDLQNLEKMWNEGNAPWRIW